ncbi:tetratricopeptide repeat protein [Zoogloea sp.]|uniref:tetratricopeptide repeat protein n=1 Tax=Zoogloea sp. TaxID=49181 RepID=UPI0035B4B149
MKTRVAGPLLLTLLALAGSPAHALLEMSESGATRFEASAQESPFAAKLRTGHEALRKLDYARADALFDEAARLDPRSPLPALGHAESARIRNLPDDVQKWLKHALEVAPRNADALTAWGRWQYARKHFPDAEKAWKAAIAADPKAALPLVDLGDLNYNIRRNADLAADFYRRALQLNPRLGGAHYALGTIWLDKKNPGNAIGEFEAAIGLSPGNPLPLHGLGLALQMQQDFKGAHAAFDRALAANADYDPARLAKGDIFLAQGDVQRAIAEYQTVARAQPKRYDAQLKLGMAHQRAGQLREAQTAYQAAVRIDPERPLPYNNMAWMAAEDSARPSDAVLDWARKAVALAPKVADFQDTLGWVHYKRGEMAAAIAVLEKVSRAEGRGAAGIHHRLGLAYAAAGRPRDAVAAFRTALRLDPNFTDAADARAQLARLDSPAKP